MPFNRPTEQLTNTPTNQHTNQPQHWKFGIHIFEKEGSRKKERTLSKFAYGFHLFLQFDTILTMGISIIKEEQEQKELQEQGLMG